MGLLSKAADSAGASAGSEVNEVVLDALALKERLGRLPQKKTTPYTALSLLKAYGTFQTGICLALKDNVYVSYASVGLGIGTISIPAEKIWRPEKACEKFFMHESGKDLEIKKHEDSFAYWIFPLISETNSAESFTEEPWEAVMILGVYDLPFNAKTVSAILDGIAARILLKPDTELVKVSPEENLTAESVNETDSTVEDFTDSAPTGDDYSANVSDSVDADEIFTSASEVSSYIDETDSAVDDLTVSAPTGDEDSDIVSDSTLTDETFTGASEVLPYTDETDSPVEELTVNVSIGDEGSINVSDSTLADETFPGASEVSPYTDEVDSAVDDFIDIVLIGDDSGDIISDSTLAGESFPDTNETDPTVEDFTDSVPTSDDSGDIISDSTLADESFSGFDKADSAVNDLIDIASIDDENSGGASVDTIHDETFSGTPEEIISKFNKLFPVFNCVVFDIPDYVDPVNAGSFSANLSRIIKMMGKVIPLNSGCPLVLFSPGTDRDLIAHRLSKTLNTNILFSFEADSSETVINTIQPLL